MWYMTVRCVALCGTSRAARGGDENWVCGVHIVHSCPTYRPFNVFTVPRQLPKHNCEATVKLWRRVDATRLCCSSSGSPPPRRATRTPPPATCGGCAAAP
eukprot:786001-Prymnesium_polylepis.1